jgi:hypothetical protein
MSDDFRCLVIELNARWKSFNEVRRIAANMRGWADAAREERLIALGTSSKSAMLVVGERV